jgi:hypothetical protein
MTTSARKSFGEYKAVIIHEHFGRRRSEILGKSGSVEKVQQQTKFYSGPSEILHYRRGLTFRTRETAIAHAQATIESRLAEHRASLERHAAYRKNVGLPDEPSDARPPEERQ